MKKIIINLIFASTVFAFGQQTDNSKTNAIIITPEILFGITGEANTNFPDRKLQKQFLISLAWDQKNNKNVWAQRLKNTRTGITVGYTDLGNVDKLGSAVSILPFIEFNAFKMKRLKIHVGTGVSYFNKKFDSINNPNNKAVSTDLSWSFRLFSYYTLFETKTVDWRIGAGYYHHSNGHSRLPNQGFNSFLLSLSADIKTSRKSNNESVLLEKIDLQKSKQNYFSLRTGYGVNTLSRAFNARNDIYTFSGEYGKIYNDIYKIGIGFYYRFYENYYNYISDNESLVQDGREFASLKKNPTWNASNIGISINGELLLNHIGIDLQVGFNLHKPSYKIDWRINQGWEYVPQVIPESNTNIVLGELSTYYKIKRLISTRFGLKYYLINTNKKPKSNFYIGTFINGNLGQADFTELSVGYVHRLN